MKGKNVCPLTHAFSEYLEGADCGPVSPCSPIEADKRHSLVEEKDTRTGMSPFSVADVMNKGWKERLPGGRIFEWALKGKQEFSGWRRESGRTMPRAGGAQGKHGKGAW